MAGRELLITKAELYHPAPPATSASMGYQESTAGYVMEIAAAPFDLALAGLLVYGVAKLAYRGVARVLGHQRQSRSPLDDPF